MYEFGTSYRTLKFCIWGTTKCINKPIGGPVALLENKRKTCEILVGHLKGWGYLEEAYL